jgi:phage/plasmid-associated DNA primase
MLSFDATKDMKTVHTELGALVNEQLTLVSFKDRTEHGRSLLMFYDSDKGFFQMGAIPEIRNRLRDIDPVICVNGREGMNEVIEWLCDRCPFPRQKYEDFESPDYIVLKNGSWSIKDKLFVEHSPDHRAFAGLPVDYNPEAKCPRFMNFIQGLLEIEDLPTLQIFLGASLLRVPKALDTILWIHGETDAGKTQLANILKEFYGEDSASSLLTEQFDLRTHKFMLGQILPGKRLNICDDNGKSDKPIEITGFLKTVVSGGTITLEQKGGSSFPLSTLPALLFISNNMVKVDDDSIPTFKRFAFFRAFAVPKEQRIKDFWKTITSDPAEMSGILNWVLEGLHKFLENGMQVPKRFTYEEYQAYYNLATNTLDEFVNQFVEIPDPEKDPETHEFLGGASYLRESLYIKWLEFCEVVRVPNPYSIVSFVRAVNALPSFTRYNTPFRGVPYKTERLKAEDKKLIAEKLPYLLKEGVYEFSKSWFGIDFRNEDFEKFKETHKRIKSPVVPLPEAPKPDNKKKVTPEKFKQDNDRGLELEKKIYKAIIVKPDGLSLAELEDRKFCTPEELDKFLELHRGLELLEDKPDVFRINPEHKKRILEEVNL